MTRLRMFQTCMATAVLSAGLIVLPAFSADTQTFAGKISDSTCNLQHNENPDSAVCVRICAKRGAKHVLLTGDKVYALNSDDPAMLSKMDKLAWQQVKVTGTPHGNAIAVESVRVAK